MNKERKVIYDKTGGKCYYCGCDLPKRWHSDHLVPIWRNRPDESLDRYDIKRGKDTIENKVPSCPRCNLRKDVFDIETFRDEIAAQVERLMKHSNQFRLALDYGLIEITDKEVEFYFERINK